MPMDEATALGVLKEQILKHGTVDEADLDEDTLEYMAGTLAEGGDREDIAEAIGPFLLDMGCVEEEDDATALAMTILDALNVAGEPAPEMDDAPKVLESRVILSAGVKEQAEKIAGHLATTLDSPATLMINTTIKVWGDGGLTEEDLTDKQLRDLLKKRKRDDKKFQKDMRFVKATAERRAILIEALKTKPVIIHRDATCAVVPDLNFESVSMDLDGKVLLEDATCAVVAGRRYGLVGKNGSGKTTFLRHIAAKAFPSVPVLQQLQIVHIEQEVEGDERTVLATVLATDFEREALLEEEADIQAAIKKLSKSDPDRSSGDRIKIEAEVEELSERLGEIYARLADIDSDTAEVRASQILAGLQFTPEMQQRPTNSFSGGWRMRIALSLALFINPDVLLLDEPTNHLDLHAVIWLEEYLQTWDNTLIVVSHARDFLNSICTDTLHLHDQQLKRYKNCNYDAFEQVRFQALENQQSAHESQEKQREHMQAFVDKFRYSAKRAAMAQSRIKALEKMTKIAAVDRDPNVSLSFAKAEVIAGPLIQLIDVSFGYGAKAAASKGGHGDGAALFEGVNLNVDMDSRIALVGPNGVGKSTLLKCIVGDLEPTTGLVQLNNKLRIGKFTQHHVDMLDMTKTPLEMLTALAVSMGQPAPLQTLRSHLGSMGLSGHLALQPIHTMSGGQKSRVSLAMLTWPKPHLMLLDEPTNHLDLETVQALVEALCEYNGGVLVVSHDEHLITSVCDTLWVAGEKKVVDFKGDFLAYKKAELRKL